MIAAYRPCRALAAALAGIAGAQDYPNRPLAKRELVIKSPGIEPE